MNQIEQSTIQLYYGLLQAEKNAKVCEETLASERRTLELVRTRYELGDASAIEVKTQGKQCSRRRGQSRSGGKHRRIRRGEFPHACWDWTAIRRSC